MHDVETMVFAVEDGRPWHFDLTDSRAIVTEGLSFAEQVQAAIDAAPVLGSSYSLNPVFAKLADGSQLRVPDTNAVVRDYDGKVLPGAVKNQMTLRQPRRIFERLQRIVDGAENATLTAAGYLRDGCRMWACVKVGTCNPTGKAVDKCYRHLVFVTGFDGSLSTQVMCALTRAVCWNTVQICMMETSESDETKVKVKNTKNASENLDKAEVIMRQALERFGVIEKRIEKMAETPITSQQVSDLLDNILEISSKKEGRGKARAQAKKERIEALYNGKGMGSEEIQGTLWGLHNAITEYFDHEGQVNGVRTASNDSGVQNSSDASRVLDSLWLGPIARHKAAADAVIDEFMNGVTVPEASTLNDIGPSW